MNNEMRKRYLQAASTPDEYIFLPKDVMEILGYNSHISAQRFDTFGLIKVKRNKIGHRRYSYNQIEFMKKLQKLVDVDISLFTIKTLMEFEKSKGGDPVKFIEDFAEFYKLRIYSTNRNNVRKAKKQK